MHHNGSAAGAEFQQIIDHRGIVVNFPLGALAHLELGNARLQVLQRDAKAKGFLLIARKAAAARKG